MCDAWGSYRCSRSMQQLLILTVPGSIPRRLTSDLTIRQRLTAGRPCRGTSIEENFFFEFYIVALLLGTIVLLVPPFAVAQLAAKTCAAITV
jgi:hypothetical protein